MTNTSSRRLNARIPEQPPELPRMGIKVGKEVARGVAKVEPLTPRGAHQRPPLLSLLTKVTPRSAHLGDNASPEGTNSKKRRVAWMAKSLMAAGLGVKFSAEE